jgi:hypothetical protein
MTGKDRKWKDLKENEKGIPREKYGNRRVQREQTRKGLK